MRNDKDFKNIQEINIYLSTIATKLDQDALQNALNSSGNRVRNIIEEAFVNEADPNTKQKWQELKKTTRLRKLRSGKSSKILRNSGALASSWHIQNTKNMVKVYNNMASSKDGFSYGIVHQFGSAKNNLPSRGFLPINDDGKISQELEEEILDIFDKFLSKAF